MNLKDLINKLITKEEYSLKIKSIRSALWSFLGRGCSQFVRMIGSLILTRILYPEAFGLMATANTIMIMIHLFADTGVQTAIIQNPKGNDKQFLDTAWMISIFRGILLCLIISVLAVPFAKFYQYNQLQWILLILAVSPLLDGFVNPALALFLKNFKVEKFVVYELITQVLGLICSIILSIIMKSVYALAIGTSISAVLELIFSYVMIKYRPSFKWNKEIGIELFHFGKFIFLNTMISWATLNIDLLIIGKIINMKKVGFYSLGRNIALILPTISMSVVSQSFFPAASSISKDTIKVFKLYKKTIIFFLFLAIPALMVISLFSKYIMQLLYDPRYLSAYIVIFWFGLRAIFQIISQINGNTFIALGKPVYETISMAVGLVLILVLVPIFAKSHGLSGAAMAMFFSMIVTALVETIFLMAKFKMPTLTAINPWINAISVSLILLICYYFLTPHFKMLNIYEIIYMVIFTMISFAISFIAFKIWDR